MENVKVTVEEPSGVKRKISVEVPAEEVAKEFRETFKEYRRQAVIPGYRKGKVPQGVIESRFRKDVTDDVTRKILPDSYEQALKQENLKPISEPEVGEFTVEEGKALTYTAEFEILPPVEVKDYLGLEVEQREVVVEEEELNKLLEEIRSGQATVSKISEDRGLRSGDVAMIDFEGVVEGKPIPGGSATDFPLNIGSDTFLPGFEDSLVGAKVGEEREFFLKLPEDFHEGEIAGKEAKFQVTLKEIREKVLPEMDDDFAKDVGDYENLEDLKEKMRNNLRATKEMSTKEETRDRLLDLLVERNPIEVPPSMVLHRQAMMASSVERNLAMRGMAKEEIEKNRDKIFQDAAEPAEKRVRASLLLNAVAEKESIELTDEELNGEIKKIAERNKISPADARRRMVENDTLDNLREMMLEEKTSEFLLEKSSLGASPSAEKPEQGKE